MPRDIKYFEDFTLGELFESRQYVITHKEIVEFAEKYDPQSFHTGNKEQSNIAPLFDELTCSGYHTAAICMRLLCDSFLSNTACLTSPGLEYVKWRAPLSADDMVIGKFRIVDKRRSNSNPQIGILCVEEELLNQESKVVYQSKITLFVGIRQEN